MMVANLIITLFGLISVFPYWNIFLNLILILLTGWCFCKREQELGKLPQAILTPCTLTLKEIETELIRLLEIRELKSVTGPRHTLLSQQPECDHVEMNPPISVATNPPRKPPPFRPSLDTHYTVNTAGRSSQPTSPKQTPTSSTADDKVG